MCRNNSSLIVFLRWGATFFLTFLLVSCGKKDIQGGDLVGIGSKSFFSETPYGMAVIPQGVFEMGSTSEDISGADNSPLKTVSMTSFYMDDTEITNSEYRQFTNWVRDSVVRVRLAKLAEELELTSEDEDGIGIYAFKDSDTTEMNAYQKYLVENYPDHFRNFLNWDVDIIWDVDEYIDSNYAGVMDSVYLPLEETVAERMINPEKVEFRYSWFDSENAFRSRTKTRKEFVREEVVNIYPDTSVWVKDFSYAHNDPMHNKYFYHDAFSEYPVVGVNWFQARAFCVWRTMFKNIEQKALGETLVTDFRLPTEAEWEYAARGGVRSSKYPWAGSYALNERGCYLANFKPLRGDYAADGALYTSKIKTYQPNQFNLYDMAGNVSEWTNSAFHPDSYGYVSDINPNVTNYNHKKKVIRGGSWKDIAFYLEVSSRDYEYADSARSYIGFRTVQDYLGERNSR